MTDKKFLRMIDANFNRAKEGLRVVEDIARFFLEDAGLTAALKRCRHDLTLILPCLHSPYKKLIQARDASGDVGRKSWIRRSGKKIRWQDLMIANLRRAQEATRVLEESAKVVSPGVTPQFQRLRFRLYELEKRSLRKF